VQTSKLKKQELERFGCSFNERTGVFSIACMGKRLSQVSFAELFACLCWVRTKHGPMVLLAFEISPMRPLPTYCYFPFNLAKYRHRRFLDQLTSTSELRLNLLVGKKSVKRVHRLTPYVRARSAENLANASSEMADLEASYDFSGALLSIERHVRIPNLLNRLLLEESFGEALENIAEALKLVPDERKLLAKRSADEIATDFLPFYEKNQDQFLETVRQLSIGLVSVMDLHRLFFGDPNGFAKFLADAFAACYSDQEIIGFRNLIMLIISFSKLPVSNQSVPAESNSRVPTASASVLNLVQGMVKSGFQKTEPVNSWNYWD
jgi:hypothetical protein